MKSFQKIYVLICVLVFMSQTTLFAQRIVTDSFDFGFEGTSVADWTQVAGFEEETTIVASGSKSMKANMTYPVQTPKLQTFRNSNTSNGSFDLIAGDYTVTVMVYLVGDSPSWLKISPTNAPIIPDFSLQGVAKGAWVKLEMPFTVSESEARNDAWVVVQFLNLPSTGSGTVYIDDIVISGEEIIQEEETPNIFKIETKNGAHLSLDKGTYSINMQVWLDPATTMTYFYTTIKEPWTSIKWDLEGMSKGEWVTLEKTFQLKTNAEKSTFTIQINNNPEYGGGTGTFFIDDIEIIKSKSPYEDNDNFLIQSTGETCPDVNNGQIVITAKSSEDYQVEFNGDIYDFSDKITIDNVAPNAYSLCISVKNTTFKACYEISIDEATNVTGKISNSKSSKVIVDVYGGTPPFDVSINDDVILQTSEMSFEIAVNSGDLLKINSSKNCEGLMTEKIGDLDTIKLYPNPVTDLLHVVFPEPSRIYMYDMLGNQVLSVQQSSNRYLDIPVSNLSRGMYVVEIVSGNNISIHKIMID